jgi:hypothetical protein
MEWLQHHVNYLGNKKGHGEEIEEEQKIFAHLFECY